MSDNKQIVADIDHSLYDFKDIENEIRPFAGLKTLIIERDTGCPMPQFRVALEGIIK